MAIVKKCYKCKQELDEKLFHRNKNTTDGLQAYCKECVKPYTKTNKEKLSLYHKKYRENNKKKAANYSKEYRFVNKKQLANKLDELE
jgi:hypothetical protein